MNETSGRPQDRELIGQIRGLLEAWDALGTDGVSRLDATKRYRIKELRDCISFSFVVETMGRGTDKGNAELLRQIAAA